MNRVVSDFLFEADLVPRKGLWLRLTNRATGERVITRTHKDGSFTVELSPGFYKVERSLPNQPWREVGLSIDIAPLK